MFFWLYAANAMMLVTKMLMLTHAQQKIHKKNRIPAQLAPRQMSTIIIIAPSNVRMRFTTQAK